MGLIKKKKKISFWTVKSVPKQVRVSFRTADGERKSFTATKMVPREVKVSFWASTQGRKTKRRRR